MHYGAQKNDKAFHIKTSCLKFAEDIYYNGDTSNEDWDSKYTQIYAYDTDTGCMLQKKNDLKDTQIQLYVPCRQFAKDIIDSYPSRLLNNQ